MSDKKYNKYYWHYPKEGDYPTPIEKDGVVVQYPIVLISLNNELYYGSYINEYTKVWVLYSMVCGPNTRSYAGSVDAWTKLPNPIKK